MVNLTQMSVPTPLYPQIINLIHAYLNANNSVPEKPTESSPSTSTNGWTREEIHALRSIIVNNKTATALMDLACANPGTRISFVDACNEAKRGPSHGRADFNGFTRTIHKKFGENRGWPLEWEMDGSKTLYFVVATIAMWWLE